MRSQIFISHSALFYSLLRSLPLSTLSLCRRRDIMRKGWEKVAERRERHTKRTRLGKRNWGKRGALECSCNQGLCAQEGPINPAVCLYVSSDILKTAKNELQGPGGILRLLRERATGGSSQESVITAAQNTTVLKVWAAVKVQRKWLTSVNVFTATVCY